VFLCSLKLLLCACACAKVPLQQLSAVYVSFRWISVKTLLFIHLLNQQIGTERLVGNFDLDLNSCKFSFTFAAAISPPLFATKSLKRGEIEQFLFWSVTAFAMNCLYPVTSDPSSAVLITFYFAQRAWVKHMHIKSQKREKKIAKASLGGVCVAFTLQCSRKPLGLTYRSVPLCEGITTLLSWYVCMFP